MMAFVDGVLAALALVVISAYVLLCHGLMSIRHPTFHTLGFLSIAVPMLAILGSLNLPEYAHTLLGALLTLMVLVTIADWVAYSKGWFAYGQR